MLLAEEKTNQRLYELQLRDLERSPDILLVQKASVNTWHQHLAHLNFNSIDRLTQTKHISVINPRRGKTPCEPCMLSKSHKFPHPPCNTIYKSPLLLIYQRVATISISSMLIPNSCYEMSEVLQCIQNFKILAERQTSRQLKMIQTDNAREFLSMSRWL